MGAIFYWYWLGLYQIYYTYFNLSSLTGVARRLVSPELVLYCTTCLDM